MSDTLPPSAARKPLRDYVVAVIGLTVLLPLAILVGVFRRKILRRN